MAMFILLEQNLGKQSSHYEHILSLPNAYDLPLFWSEEERKRSHFGTTTYAETLALDDEVIQDYELLKHHLGEDFFREQNITMLLTTIPFQLLSYHIAVMLDKNVDQPRNLAKSVTVE